MPFLVGSIDSNIQYSHSYHKNSYLIISREILVILVAEGAVSTKMNTLASIKNTFVLIFLTTIFF